MAKENKVSVAEYHTKLKDIKIRVPKADEEVGIPDYVEIIKTQASMICQKKYAINEYVLNLIEKDIQTNPEGLHDPDFKIRSISEINKLKASEN